MQQLRELACPILAMFATLTASQIDVLKQKYVRSDQCLVMMMIKVTEIVYLIVVINRLHNCGRIVLPKSNHSFKITQPFFI